MGIWSGSVRVDVAVINGELGGFELKSARDNLERLESQAALYNQVFDRMTLVSAYRHTSKALSKIPEWWGVINADIDNNGTILLEEERKAEINPSVEAIQVARLLWRQEALDVLISYGQERGVKSKPAEKIYTRLADSLPVEKLREEVRACLKRRTGWLRNFISD